jgi:uncharacterized membrane protein YoaK (UPF0700 family)
MAVILPERGLAIVKSYPQQERTLVSLLVLLTAGTGLVDAVSYLGIGQVFTANMTGNIILLGFAAVGTLGFSLPRSLTALAGFLIGAVGGGRIACKLVPGASSRWMTAAIGSESLLLLGATLVAIGYQSGTREALRTYALILLTALAMGVRNAIVRKLAVADLTTTVLTLTITGLAADSSLAGGTNPRWERRALSIGCMLTGAGLGALLLRHSLALALAAATSLTSAVAVCCHTRLVEFDQRAAPRLS